MSSCALVLDPVLLLVLPDEMLVMHVFEWFFLQCLMADRYFLVFLVWFMVCSSVVVSGAQ